MTITNLLAEYAAALQAGVTSMDPEHPDPAIGERFHRARNAILRARPTDPADMALQLRWLIQERQSGDAGKDEDALLEHIAEQLERLSRS
jgi:hypothetical protein